MPRVADTVLRRQLSLTACDECRCAATQTTFSPNRMPRVSCFYAGNIPVPAGPTCAPQVPAHHGQRPHRVGGGGGHGTNRRPAGDSGVATQCSSRHSRHSVILTPDLLARGALQAVVAMCQNQGSNASRASTGSCTSWQGVDVRVVCDVRAHMQLG